MYKPLKEVLPYRSQEPSNSREMLNKSSVPELIDKLCVKFSEGLNENSNIKRKECVKRLKTLAFQILLMRSTSNFDKEYDIINQDELIATLVDKVYTNELRSSAWTKKKTDELQRVVDMLSDILIERPSLGCVIRFLLSLSNQEGISNSKSNLNSVDAIKYNFESHIRLLQSLPGLNSFASSESSKKNLGHQPSVFDFRMMVDSPFSYSNSFYKITDIKDYPFDFEPGSGLKLFEEFTSLWPSKNKGYNRFSREFSDYGGIKRLSIPELNLEVPRSLTIPSLRSSHLDEGYVTPDKEFVDDDKKTNSVRSVSSVWNNLDASSLVEPLHYTWENLGKPDSKKELPSLLQSDRDVIEYWKRHSQLLKKCNSRNAFVESIGNTSYDSDGEGLHDEFITISFKEFFRDVKCLLISVTSGTFYFDEVLNTFVIKPGISIPGITPEGLELYSRDLIECGNNFRSLNLLVKRNHFNTRSTAFDPNLTNSTLSTLIGSNSVSYLSCVSEGAVVHRGVIFEALCTSICCWLQAYRGVVIKMISQDSESLLDIKEWLHPLQQQLQFLVNLCCPPIPDFNLPTGGALLTHIYNIVEVTISKPFSYIVFHILEKCCKVYFRFLENWLFEGICDDLYGEFFIEQRSSYENFKDRSYWRKAFFLRPERVPVFLSDLVNDIFVSGKTLNLVKFCNPNDVCFGLWCPSSLMVSGWSMTLTYQPLTIPHDGHRVRKIHLNQDDKKPILLKAVKNFIFIRFLSSIINGNISEDPLCIRLENVYPRMSPCFEENSLDKLTAEYNQFVMSCKKACAAVPLAKFLSVGSDTDELRENHLKAASQQRAESLQKIKDAQQEQLRKEDEKKRQLFIVMKNDMLEAEKRKKEVRQKTIEEDQKRLDKLAQAALIEESKRDEEKKKIIQFYKSLNAAADNRKLRAEWKIKRLELNEKRIDFLAEDREFFKGELFNNKLCTITKGDNDCDNMNDTLINCTSNIHSVDSYSSWMTCPTNSIDNGLQVNGSVDDSENDIASASNDIKSKEAIENIDSVRSGSFDCLLDVRDVETNKLKSTKSSSDTDLYVSSTNCNLNESDTFNRLVKYKQNRLYVKADKINQINNISSNISSKLESKILSINDSSSIASVLNEADIEKSNSVKQIMPPKLLNNQSIIRDRHSSEAELIEVTYGSMCDSNEKQVLNKMFSDTRNAALLNKHKVLESEYGINVIKPEIDSEKLDVGSSKDKVLEMKTKMNESAIRQRTEQLAIATSNFIESRKAAARNKAKVMNSEYSIFMHKYVKTDKEEVNKNVIDKYVNPSIEEKLKDNQSTQFIFKENTHERINSSEGNDTKSDKISKKSYIMNSEFVDSDGRFTMDSKPIIADIADRIMPQKNDSVLLDENTNYITIRYCLHKSVSVPTEIQKIFTNDSILRLFILNEKLMDHLECIRCYFFLLDGEYGRTLTRNLFTDLENVEQPSVLLTYLRLNSILRSAIRSVHNESPLVERLSFFVKDTPLVFVLTDSEVLNCLSMRYRVHWPLNIILTDDAIINYDRIFAFQLKIQRAVWALEQDIHLLKMKNMMRSSHYRQLQIFRHIMTQFVRAMSNYIIRIALEESWVEFKHNLSKADTLDGLYSAHVDYIKMTLFRCLLNKRSETIHKTIMGLLRNILTFHELLRTGEWVYDLQTGDHVHSAFTRLSNQYSSFVRTLRYLVKFLNQVICYGYQPHLDVLITFLSGNDFYLMEA